MTDEYRMSGIYSIRNMTTGLQYVGSAVQFTKRWNLHRSDLRRNRHHSTRLQDAWCQYGDDAFEWLILEVVERDRLIEREQFWMDHFQSSHPDKGYNITAIANMPPSPLGIKRSAAMKAKIAASHIGIRPDETARAKMRAAAAKRTFSEITRARMSAAAKAGFRGFNKGKVMSAEQKAKISASLLRRNRPSFVPQAVVLEEIGA